MARKTEDSSIQAKPHAWLQRLIDNPKMQKKLYQRTLLILVLSQIFGGLGIATGITVGALLAQDMLGSDSYGGVSTALFTLGSAGAAYFVGRLSQRYGRRPGLVTGFFAGGIGAIGVVISAVLDNIPLLFASLLIYGAGASTNLLARYAGTDLANTQQRATAISIVLVSTTFGAVAGPNLVELMGEFGMTIGVPALAGPFILAATAFILAGLVLLIFLRPDPFVVAKAIANEQNADENNPSKVNHIIGAVDKQGIIVGATIMVLTQIVMVSIMTMTPIHMGHHGHGIDEVGLIISIHISAMFLPSLVTGVLVDKIGRTPMAIAAGVTLLAAGVLAAVAPTDSMQMLSIALALLGLGWNFGLISGTALIVDATSPFTRAKTQGTVDVLIALSGVSGAAMSGIIVAHSSYATLSLAGGVLSLLLLPVIVWSKSKPKVITQEHNNAPL